MEEKKIVYQIILDIWNLAKKYVFAELDDKGWEQFVNEAMILSDKYKNQDPDVKKLFSDIYFAFEKYKTAKQKSKS